MSYIIHNGKLIFIGNQGKYVEGVAPAPPDTNFFEIETYGTTIYNLRAGNSLSSGSNPLWNMGDGSTRTTINSTFSYTYTDPYLEPVSKKIKFTYDNIEDVSVFYVYGGNATTQVNKISSVNLSNLTGPLNDLRVYNTTGLTSLNLSKNTKLGGGIRLYYNTTLSSLTFPAIIDAGASNISVFNIYNCPSLNSLDLSGLTKLGGSIRFDSNTRLSSLTFPATIDAGANNITHFYASSCSSLNSLDLSVFTKLGGNILFNSNTTLSSLTFPATIDAGANNITFFWVDTCTKLNSLDLSMLTKLGGSIRLNTNTILSSLTLPATIDAGASNISVFYAHSCLFLNSLDLSGFTKLGGDIRIYDNTRLSSLTFPTTIDAGANNITTFHAYSCPSLNSLDLSELTKLYGTGVVATNQLRLDSCTTLETVEFPVIDNGAWYCYSYNIRLENCALDASTVDQVFLRLKDFYTTNTPIGNVTVNTSGGTNSPPSTDGSTYISDLQTIFSNASKTISITVNS